MRRFLAVALASLAFSGCLQVLGDYDLEGKEATSGSSSSGTSLPCWFREGDGFCACQPEAPTAEYVAADSCAPIGYPAAGACCAFDGFPQSGSCVCAPIRCLVLESNPDSCVCGIYAPAGEGFDEQSSCYQGQPCCSRPGSCECNATACDIEGGDVEVTSCDVDVVASTIPCGEGGTPIDTCK